MRSKNGLTSSVGESIPGQGKPRERRNCVLKYQSSTAAQGPWIQNVEHYVVRTSPNAQWRCISLALSTACTAYWVMERAAWWLRGIFSCSEFSALKSLQTFEPQNVVGYWRDYWCVRLLLAGCPRQDTYVVMGLYTPDDYFSFFPNPMRFQLYSDLISTRSFHEISRGNHRHCKLKPKSHFQMLGKR